MEERWESIGSAGKKKECAEEVARKACLRRRIVQTLSEMGGARMFEAGKRLFLLLGYALLAKTAES